MKIVGTIFLVHTKTFDREHQIGIFLAGEPPNISESSGHEWSFAKLAERGVNYAGSRKDPM